MKKLILLFLCTLPLSAQPIMHAAAQAGTNGPYIALTWTASPTSGATYNIYRTTTSGTCPTTVSGYTSIISGVTGTSYSDTTATSVAVYCYVVTASGGGLQSAPSNSAAVAVLPQPPTGLSATSH